MAPPRELRNSPMRQPAPLRALAWLAARYSAAAAARPLTTTCTAGLIIASVGDAACQRWFEPPGAAYDARRTLDMGLIRALVLAPLLHVYFPFLAWLVPGRTLPRVLLRVLADQALGSPATICLTFAASGVLKGDVGGIPARVSSQLLPTMVSGAQYWPLVHTANFLFVPVGHQALVAHVMSVYWNMVLSFRANKKLEPDDGAAAAPATRAAPAAGAG